MLRTKTRRFSGGTTEVRLGGRLEHVHVVACQPASLEEGIGLTPPVASAIDGALDLCRQLPYRRVSARRRRDNPVIVPVDPMLAPDASSGRPVVDFSDVARYLGSGSSEMARPHNGSRRPRFRGLGLFADLQRYPRMRRM